MFRKIPSFTLPPFRVSVVRPDDFLALEFEFINLKRVAGNPPQLERQDPEKPAYLIASFPPQNIAEEAFFEAGKQDPIEYKPDKADFDRPEPPDAIEYAEPASLPFLVRARMSGPSRLVFKVPENVQSIDLTLPSLLEKCSTWELNLAPGALPAPSPKAAKISYLGGDPHVAIAEVGLGVLSKLGSQLAQEASAAVQAVIEDQVAGIVKDALAEAISSSNAPDLFDVEEIVSLGVQQALAALPARASQEVSEMDATGLWDLFDSSVNILTSEVAARVEMVVEEHGLEASLAGTLLPLLKPAKPGRTATAIELPYRLLISPNKYARWVHSLQAVTHANRTELWHTRLGIRQQDGSVSEAPHNQRTLRAIWSPDYHQPQAATHIYQPFRMSLTARDRSMLVDTTAGYDLTGYMPLPTYARRLMLTSLGGWLDTEGIWDDPVLRQPHGIEMLAWKHQAAAGRDQYVRVVYDGYLLGFGHGTSVIKVTERAFQDDSLGRAAYLRQSFYIVVRQPVVTYPGEAQFFNGRQFPFTKVRIKSLVTPKLDEPGTNGQAGDDGLKSVRTNIYPDQPSEQALFWPFVGGKPFEFELVATDLAGREVDFRLPLIFISKEKGLPFMVNYKTGNLDDGRLKQIIAAYNKYEDRRTTSFFVHTVRYAPPSQAGDTDLETESMRFTAQLADPKMVKSLPAGLPHFYPAMDETLARVPVLQRLLGNDSPVPLVYPDVEKYKEYSYLNAGFAGANVGEVFLQIKASTSYPVQFGKGNHGDRAGGLANPDFALLGISRKAGPVGGQDLAALAGGKFIPSKFFQSATFLGGLSLHSILSPALDFADMPQWSHSQSSNTKTRFAWKTKALIPDPTNLFLPHAKGPSSSTLSIESAIEVTGANQSVSSITAVLDNFKINLFGFIIVWFDQFSFTATEGKKPDVDIKLRKDHEVTFGGPLAFVNELRKYIPDLGFSDPPDLDITAKGVTASYTLGLPPVVMGVFLLENIKMRAVCRLSFDGSPAYFRFNFAERYDTFVLTVSALGGGGFFALAVQSDGVKELEAALEFVGSVGLNVGVASGGV